MYPEIHLKVLTHMHVNKKLEKHTENIDILFTSSNAFHSGTKLFSVVFRLCNFVFFSDTFPSLPSLGSVDLEHANLASTPQREVEQLRTLLTPARRTPFLPPMGTVKIIFSHPNKIID